MRPDDLLARLEAGYAYDPMYGQLCNERDRLKAENAKLRDKLDAAKHDLSLFSERIVELGAENAKLRRLVDGLRYCANESHGHGRCSVRFVDGYATHCPLYDVDSGTAKCEALMRELEIEVK